MQYWLVKTEPEEYSFDDLLLDCKTVWNGIRNYQARNNLKAMKKSDKVLVYHSGKTKEVVGIAEVYKECYPDPKDNSNSWFVVELKALHKLFKTISLEQIKREKKLANLPLLKQGRLSVMPVTKEEFEFIVSFK